MTIPCHIMRLGEINHTRDHGTETKMDTSSASFARGVSLSVLTSHRRHRCRRTITNVLRTILNPSGGYTPQKPDLYSMRSAQVVGAACLPKRDGLTTLYPAGSLNMERFQNSKISTGSP